jgi:D-xylose transport system substrate-binding protein
MGTRVVAAVLLLTAGCKSDKKEEAPAAAASGGKVALLLPESKTARYESHDRPHFERKVKELCPDCEVIYSNADQDAAKQQNQAEAALTNGAKVLVLDPVDSATIVMINGAPTDNNAKLFKAGAHSAIDGSGLKVGAEYDTPDWSPDKAQQQMEQAITQLGKDQIVGVYCANDGTAGGAIAAMKAAGVTPLPPVTGQDAELAGVQRVIAGEQFMTIYKAIKPEAEAAAQLAVTLLRGGRPQASQLNGQVNNGKKDVPSILLAPVSVTRDNVKSTIIADGFWTPAQLCVGAYKDACVTASLL